jgi:flagellar capping protein FliD
MSGALLPAQRIHAAVYAHNLDYYKQPLFRQSPPVRLRRSPVQASYREAASEIAQLLDAADQVRSAAIQVRRPDVSGLLARIAEHDAPDAIGVTAEFDASLTTYRLRVERLASAQSNEGVSLPKSSPSTVRTGLNRMAITTGGNTTIVSALIFPDDTHEQVLAKWRNAINLAEAGVKAVIVNDPAADSARLVLRAEHAGRRYAFRVSDVTGNAATVLGIDRVHEMASDAAYSVDGGQVQTSESNEIGLDGGKLRIRLNAPTVSEVLIRVLPDADRAIRDVKTLLEAYQLLCKRATDRSGYLNDTVRHFVGQVVQGFESIGIANGADGTLKLDEAKFAESLLHRYEWTRQLIGDSMGLADRLSRIAEQFERVPPSSLLNAGMRELQTYVAYRPPEGHYLQIPLTGLIHDGEL